MLFEHSSSKNVWWINCFSEIFVQCRRIHSTLATTMNNKLWQKIATLYKGLVRPNGESHYLYTIESSSELFNQKSIKFYFSSTFPDSLRCYAKRNWKPRFLSRSVLCIHWFTKKSTVQSRWYSMTVFRKRAYRRYITLMCK